MTGDLDEIKQQLKARILSLCQQLLPRGRKEGRLWVAHDPVEQDYDKNPALKVALDRDTGAWKNWRIPDLAKGDVIALVAYVNRTDTKGALAWARDWLGIRSMSREERAAMRFAAEAPKKKDDQKSRQDRAERIRRAQQLFERGNVMAPAGGVMSPAEQHAWRYFADARGIALDQVQHLARLNFRFTSETEWWRGRTWRTANGRRMRTGDGPRFPAIHSAMRSIAGSVTACHCTFLDPAGAAKAPVDPAKLMFGEAAGAVIELAMGPEGKPFWEARQAHPVILAEGIETGFSLALAAPEARVWAVGSISGFANAPVGLACIGQIFAAFDNATNATSRKQNDAALAALEASGKPVVVMKSHLGSDFNDLL